MTATRETIRDWIVSAIETQCTYAARVVGIDDLAEDLDAMAVNPPSIGVIYAGGSAAYDRTAGSGTMRGFQRLTFEVIILARKLGSGLGHGVDGSTGLYQMLDDVDAALFGKLPTGAFEELDYLDDDTRDVGDDALIVHAARYACVVQLTES
jgi:hypothetical protein